MVPSLFPLSRPLGPCSKYLVRLTEGIFVSFLIYPLFLPSSPPLAPSPIPPHPLPPPSNHSSGGPVSYFNLDSSTPYSFLSTSLDYPTPTRNLDVHFSRNVGSSLVLRDVGRLPEELSEWEVEDSNRSVYTTYILRQR